MTNPFSLDAPAPTQSGATNPFSLEAPAPVDPNAPVAAQPAPDLKDVPGKMWENLVPSAKKLGESIYEGVKTAGGYAIDHPGEVLSNLPAYPAKLGENIMSSAIERYGSWDKAKSTMAEDPAGFFMDILGVVPGLGGLGKASKIDPALAATTLKEVTAAGGRGVAKLADHLSQTAEGIGTGAVEQMFDAGKKITPGAWKTMTNGLDFDKSYGLLTDALSERFKMRADNYDINMSKVKGADTPVDFMHVDKAVDDAMKINTYKAPLDTTPGIGYRVADSASVDAARKEIAQEIAKFKAYGPAYHTAVGFDKLKRSIHNIGDGLKDGNMPTPGSLMASTVEKSIKKTIMDKVPEYGEAMKAYQADSDTLRQFMKEFSVGNPDQKMSALRKMQKVYRQSADVAHGERTNMLDKFLEGTGSEDLMTHLAASQFSPWTPRGLRGAALGIELPIAAGHAIVSPATGIPHLAGVVGGGSLMSPRLTGAASYSAGRVAGSPVGRGVAAGYRGAEKVIPSVVRTSRFTDPQEPEKARGGFFSRRGR